MNVLTFPHTSNLCHIQNSKYFSLIPVYFGRSALVNVVKVYKKQVKFHLTFEVDLKMQSWISSSKVSSSVQLISTGLASQI